MLERTRRENATDITFVLPADEPAGQVSVVGDFNDWQPGTDPMTPRQDGTRAATITVPHDRQIAFRYLAQDNHWFDDDTADGHDGHNSYLHT
jgi:1,4-alpha-glucan branching enzyme